MAAVNVVLILSFFSRGVYQLLALAHLYTMPVINLMVSTLLLRTPLLFL